jgi:hypothetical protein
MSTVEHNTFDLVKVIEAKSYQSRDPLLKATKQAMAQADPATRYRYLQELITGSKEFDRNGSWICHSLIRHLFNYTIGFETESLTRFIQSYIPISSLSCENILKQLTQVEHSPDLLQAVRELVDKFEANNSYFKTSRFFELKRLVYKDILANCTDNWAENIRNDLAELQAEEQLLWQALLLHCSRAVHSTPGRAWVEESRKLVEQIGRARAQHFLERWLSNVVIWDVARNKSLSRLEPTYASLLKGLLWLGGVIGDLDSLGFLTELTRRIYQSLPREETRKFGRALLWSLSQMPMPHNLQAIAHIQLACGHNQIQKQILQLHKQFAQEHKLSFTKLQELSLANYANFTAIGHYQHVIEGYTIKLQLRQNRFYQSLFNPQDEPITELPEAIRLSTAFKEFQRLQRLIQRDFSEQLWRIEQLYRSNQEWSFAEWRQRYLDHPLVGAIARRLIWRFLHADGSFSEAIWHKDRLVKHSGEALEGLEDLKVQLWHALGMAIEDVLAWRTWIKRHKVIQPFPQAEREVYVLTDAERQTASYSNRFAGHIFQKADLDKARLRLRWQQATLYYSDSSVGLLLADAGLRIEYWLSDPLDQSYNDNPLTSDQVRFYRMSAEEYKASHRYYRWREQQPLRVEDIPEMIFSEAMRDVDYLIRQCFTQLDPDWHDRNEYRGRVNRLTNRSQNQGNPQLVTQRREQLSSLIPRLNIASQCRLEEDFLAVRGQIHSYKIRFDNGSIFIDPSNQYLCIVSARKELIPQQTSQLLNVDQDHQLSMIISKALLLANDDQITDSTILWQLRKQQS